jgi:hypothetical protein
MVPSTMSSFHTIQDKELTPMSAWLFSRVVIALAGVLSVAPFIAIYMRG